MFATIEGFGKHEGKFEEAEISHKRRSISLSFMLDDGIRVRVELDKAEAAIIIEKLTRGVGKL